MPFAPQVRKEILQALDEHILPALEAQQVFQFLAEPPFDFSTVQHRVEREELLPHKVHSTLQVIRRWEEDHLVSAQMPCFGFTYKGVSYERIGATATLVRKDETIHQQPAGITEIEMRAPSIICYSPYVPRGYNSNVMKYWPELTSVLCFQLKEEEDVRIFLCHKYPQQAESTHHLQINDPLLVQMGHLYLEELRQKDNSKAAQALLFVFMCRLKRYLLQHRPGFSNSCWVDTTSTTEKINTTPGIKHRELCNEIVDYIQAHLHLPLTLDTLSAHFGFSAFHINNIFQQALGTTVMRYVTAQRIEVAKKIIVDTPERISDVAQLTGFASAASFCTVFRKHTGFTPGKFRNQEHHKHRNIAK